MKPALLIATCCFIAATNAARAGSPELGDLGKVGSVHFPTSCDPAVQQEFERGVALLHSFFYDEARRIFMSVAEKDPECAMAHWGVAMTYYHPIWTAPDSSELAQGRAAVERALKATKKNDRERGFIHAMEAFYMGVDDPQGASVGAPSCHALTGLDPKGRAACFRREMERVAAHNPEDTEAAAFFALSLLGTAPPGDPLLANQTKAAEILESRYAKEPNHPGLAHYLIHTYDYPALATKGLPAANAYAAMQPWVPHALHMPSHIYTRLGMWKETIASNAASAEASRKYAAQFHPGAASFEELHALDYLVYAHLQRAEDEEAKEILHHVTSIKRTHPETDFVVAYAFGAIPARYALERRAWKEAATLQVRPMPFWNRMPFAEGLIMYARAVGAAKSGDKKTAESAARRLGELSTLSKDPRFKYFAEQMEVQRQAAVALLAVADGRREEGVAALRTLAAREDSLGKHPVSPGALLPIRELLGEVLLESGRAEEALTEYEASLRIYPGRFNGLSGAAQAAEKAGKKDVARRYSQQLIDLAGGGDGQRPELAHAKEFLAGSQH
ncbi:MAG TPA: hypothetical protein VFP10_15735 [Candidatus Eisenbacteria bacterium]|nr:hypothetical protein [Candidatus Eisenbacteria bacterium]